MSKSRSFSIYLLKQGYDATDRQIDQLVYELYGLTDDEIRIVADSTRS